MASMISTARSLAGEGVAYAPEIAGAAERHGLDPRLLAAVAAQETGGPGSNAGRNVLGDGGHGHGIFQIDDRFHGFARTPAAMQPAANADYAASMLSGLIGRFGGDVHKALSAYNAGDPNATGTVTSWQDGQKLGYADSVLRHYAQLGGAPESSLAESMSAEINDEQSRVNALSAFATLCPPSPQPQQQKTYSWRDVIASSERSTPQT